MRVSDIRLQRPVAVRPLLVAEPEFRGFFLKFFEHHKYVCMVVIGMASGKVELVGASFDSRVVLRPMHVEG